MGRGVEMLSKRLCVYRTFGGMLHSLSLRTVNLSPHLRAVCCQAKSSLAGVIIYQVGFVLLSLLLVRVYKIPVFPGAPTT